MKIKLKCVGNHKPERERGKWISALHFEISEKKYYNFTLKIWKYEQVK